VNLNHEYGTKTILRTLTPRYPKLALKVNFCRKLPQISCLWLLASHGQAEIIGSSVGLVAINALVLIGLATFWVVGKREVRMRSSVSSGCAEPIAGFNMLGSKPNAQN
jgi:hypothetical protein